MVYCGILVQDFSISCSELPTITISGESLRISVLHYARTLKTTINLPFPVTVPYGTVLTMFQPHIVSHSLYFGDYTEAVACSAQPLCCSPHGSCSRPHGLKVCCISETEWCICSKRALNFEGVMSFTYAGDPLFHTMFPNTDIANIFGSAPGLEKLVAQTCVFCLRASEQSKTLVRLSYCHFEARYAVVSSSFIVE